MSQSTFLESLIRWSRDECRQNLDQALPQLVNRVLKSTIGEIDALKLLCELFVPVCPIQRLDDDVYSKIHGKIISLSDGLYEELCATISRTSEAVEKLQLQMTSLLETSMELIGCLDFCVSALLQSDSAHFSLEMGCVHSLSAIILHVLQGSYTHCKESSKIYGRFLGSLTGQLSALFKKTHALQMNFIGVVDKICLSPSDADIKDLCAILQGFYDISVVAVSLDVKVMIVMWKTISRLASQHKALLYNQLDLDPMLSSLTNDMVSSFSYMMQMVTNSNQNDGKAFIKSVKVLGFQMKVLVALVKDYCQSLESSVAGMVHLILTVQSSLAPSVQSTEIPQGQREDLERQVAVALEPLVSYLIPHMQFVAIMTEQKNAASFDQWLPLCMTLVTVSQMLFNYSDDVQATWLSPTAAQPGDRSRQSLLGAIFSSLDKCYVELCLPTSLPGIMCQGKPQKLVTLYEYICARLCGFVACIPAKYFKCAETCLLQNALSHNLHNTLLAGDIWCFLARYGSANLCRDHCALLVELLSRSGWASTTQCCHLVMTLRRLLKFLAPEHQSEFLETHPLTSTLPLYCVLPLTVFSVEAQRTIAQHLFTACADRVEGWCGESVTLTTAAAALELAQMYHALCNVCTSVDIAHHIDASIQATLVSYTYDCIFSLTAVTMEKYGKVLETLAAAAVNVLANLSAASQLGNSELLLLLEHFGSWLKLVNLETSIKLAIINFMRSLGKKKFSVDSQQAKLLQTLPRLFSTLLAETNPVVYQLALETFAVFAEETVHETIVSESLQTGDDGTQTRVVSYLNKLANGVDMSYPETELLRAEYENLQKGLQRKPLVYEHKNLESLTRMEHTEPLSKRQKVENASQIDPEVQNILKSLHSGTKQLSSLLSEYRTVPQSVLQDIHNIKEQLNAITISR